MLVSFWVNFWSSFPNFLKRLETLKNATPTIRNHCFWVSRNQVFHHFSKHFSKGVLEPTFYRFFIEFWSFWGSIWRPLPPLLRVTFSGHKKVKMFFWAVLLGWGYLGHRREKGGTARHLGQRRPGRGSEGNCAKTCVFFCRKWRARAFRVHESDLTLTKSAACAQKLASDRGGLT